MKEEKEQKRKTEKKKRLDGLNSQHLLANIIFSPVSFAIIIECKLWLKLFISFDIITSELGTHSSGSLHKYKFQT